MLAAGGVDAIPKFQKIFDNKYRYKKIREVIYLPLL